MLEVRNLTKVYRPKKGVPVTAIDHISLRFPATGMVFLLGKSGSGKSTLLNLLGGLDRYDDGEILINGASSKGFHQQHFDSYRNTYVGFIFQEYNVLEEFTVGANIALAIELQGKKATDEQINTILHQVDLDGYGNRRPNELSGGQKQRVAIARALVKQPRIIMADEPTGALDSNTGRQIFDTLKNLSRERLVVVVSHDRDFAEQYADRIIELADGRVISDMTYTDIAETPLPEQENLTYTDGEVRIAPGYHLTEEDRAAINAYIAQQSSGLTLRLEKKAKTKKSAPTDQEAIPAPSGGFSLIRSRLPLRSAFKIGASSLKYKRIRLAITILLSCVAFGLFGLADTFGSYDHIRACTDSLVDSGIDYASVVKSRLIGQGEHKYFSSDFHLSDEDLKKLEENAGLHFQGVYSPSTWDLNFSHHLSPDKDMTEYQQALLSTSFNGITEIDETDLKSFGYSLIAGTLPKGDKNEIAITAYTATTFQRMNYGDESGKTIKITQPSDMVGKTLQLNGKTFTVSGIVDTHFDLSRYAILEEKPDNHTTPAQMLIRYALQSELDFAASYSLHGAAIVGTGYVQKVIANTPSVKPLYRSYLVFMGRNDEVQVDPFYISSLADLKTVPVKWLDGQPRTTLGEKELVVSVDLIRTGQYGEDSDIDWTDAPAAMAAVQEWSKKIGTLTENSPRCWYGDDNEYTLITGYTVVGYIDPTNPNAPEGTVVTSDALCSALTDADEGEFDFAIAPMPKEQSGVRELVKQCYTEKDGVRYELQSAATYELDVINDSLQVLSVVFLYIGIGFALFAAIMLANFISTSISYKKQEIGILRAIGSRSNDVFRIFFSESFIIAMINFLLSCTGVGLVTYFINRYVRTELNVLVTVLHFGMRQGLLLLTVSLAVAALASFFPVRHIAAKRPIDAIRGR